MKESILKIIVLGKDGQLARALTELSRASSHEFLFISSQQLDLSQPEKIKDHMQNIKFDLLINAAAYTHVDNAEKEQQRALSINGIAIKVLAEVCHSRNAKMIHISSDYVYGGQDAHHLREDSLTQPNNYYGLTKLEGEKHILAAEIRHLILRTSWVYSPWGTNFVKTMLRLGSEREVLKVVSDQVGSPTYAPDLAQAILKLVEVWDAKSQDGVYNLAGTSICSWFDFSEQIFKSAKNHGFEIKVKELIPIRTDEYVTLAKRPLNSRLNQKKIKEIFGIEMPLWKDSLEQCLKRISEQ